MSPCIYHKWDSCVWRWCSNMMFLPGTMLPAVRFCQQCSCGSGLDVSCKGQTDAAWQIGTSPFSWDSCSRSLIRVWLSSANTSVCNSYLPQYIYLAWKAQKQCLNQLQIGNDESHSTIGNMTPNQRCVGLGVLYLSWGYLIQSYRIHSPVVYRCQR